MNRNVLNSRPLDRIFCSGGQELEERRKDPKKVFESGVNGEIRDGMVKELYHSL